MRCPSCSKANLEYASFCMKCGAGLTLICPQCGTELPPDSDLRFCFKCGAEIEHPADVEVSALEKTGLDDLRAAVLQTLFPAVPDDISRPIPFTHRQVSLLDKLDASNTMEIRRELLCPERDTIGPT